ncbi:MAG: polyprenyl synthetase family protein [Thermoplasmata archaeon]
MNFATVAALRPLLERRLSGDFRAVRSGAPPGTRALVRLNEQLTLRGGKRFRAIVLLAGFHLATGRDPAPAIPAAAALEHFQSWMLIHDDIIDHARERRGGPAVHRAAAALDPAGATGPGSDDYGCGIGITLGDLEEPATVGSLLETPVPAVARLRALEEYVRMTRATAFGQLLDIRNGRRPPSRVTERDVYRVHELKSAIYTVVSPLRMGALLGGAVPHRLADLTAIARDAGIAFQLRDDLLGAGFGSQTLDKSANDLIEGKRTLLIVHAWRHATDRQRARLLAALGRPDAPPSQIADAREVLRETGSVEHSERAIRRLADRSIRRLRQCRSIPPARKPLLEEIVRRLVERSR